MSEGEWAGIRPVVPWFSSSFPSEQLISSSTSTATGATHIPRGSDEFQRTWCVHGTGSPLSLFGGFDFRGCMLEPPAASRESTQSETVFSLLNPGLSRPSNIFFSPLRRCTGTAGKARHPLAQWHDSTSFPRLQRHLYSQNLGATVGGRQSRKAGKGQKWAFIYYS